MIIGIIFVFLLFFVFGIHIIYPLLLKRLSANSDSFATNDAKPTSNIVIEEERVPLVSIIIPVYNEALVIERRINNIFDSSFPKSRLELIVVDSGSNDETRSIVEQKFPLSVKLLKENRRRGKAHAITSALSICNGEIVLITDGPTLYQKDTILKLVTSLRDSSVGAVSSLYNIPNAKENLVATSENTFWTHKDNIRILESRAYSTSWLSGEACAFKKNIVTKVDEDTLADDSNIALQIISKGYKVAVNENSYFSERSPSDFYDYFRIKTRRVLGGLIETLRFKSLMFNPKYGYFGLIIFPYRFFTQFVNPIATYVALILAVPTAIQLSTYIGTFTVLIFFGVWDVIQR